jgi:alanine dehydrogenase
MYYVSENVVIAPVEQDAVTAAVFGAFVALAQGDATRRPMVCENLDRADTIFGFKAGFNRSLPAMGVEVGGLSPSNAAIGVSKHQSTLVMFDKESGAPAALIRATYLTALRTAAASALSIRRLARPGVAVLGIFGAGGQSEHQLRAALTKSRFTRILISDPSAANEARFSSRIGEFGHMTTLVPSEQLCHEGDILIIVTPSRELLAKAAWVLPETHICAMGADTLSKQEIETALVGNAVSFGDVAAQAILLGEVQHAFAIGLIDPDAIITLGRVIGGRRPGRSGPDAITIFDTARMTLQDLGGCTLALEAAVDRCCAIELE